MTHWLGSNDKLEELRSPLMRKASKHSGSISPMKQLGEIDPKVSILRNHSSNLIIKTVYKDFMSFDMEGNHNKIHNMSQNRTHFIIMYLLIYCCNLCCYRMVSNTTSVCLEDKKSKIIKEFTIFTWRTQALSLWTVAFIFIIKYFQTRNVFNDHFAQFKYLLEYDWHIIMTFDNFKLSLSTTFNNFIVLASTKYVPFSICIFFSNFWYIFNVLTNTINKEKIRNFSMLIIGMILCFYSAKKYFGIQHFTYDNKDTIIFDPIIISILFSVIVSFNQFTYHKYLISNTISNHSPLECIIGINLYSSAITTVILFIIDVFSYKMDIFSVILWIFNIKTFLMFGLLLGLLGVINMFLSFYSAIYLNANNIGLMRTLEIPFSDTLAIFLFNIFSIPESYEYYLTISSFTVICGIVYFNK